MSIFPYDLGSFLSQSIHRLIVVLGYLILLFSLASTYFIIQLIDLIITNVWIVYCTLVILLLVISIGFTSCTILNTFTFGKVFTGTLYFM